MENLGKNGIAILMTNGCEQLEVEAIRSHFPAQAQIVSLRKDWVRAWEGTRYGTTEFGVDTTIDEARDDYDGLILPGGILNVDFLRADERAVQFVRRFVEAGRPIGAIGHAPWLLIDAGAVGNRRLTAYHSLKHDLMNAGANWCEDEVVVDGNLVTSRRPGDIEAFCSAFEALLGAQISSPQPQRAAASPTAARPV